MVINLVVSFVILEKKVLLVDVDFQVNVFLGVGVMEEDVDILFYDCLVYNLDLEEVIYEMDMFNFYLIFFYINLVSVEFELVICEN